MPGVEWDKYRMILESARRRLLENLRIAAAATQNPRHSSAEMSTVDNHPADIATDTAGRSLELCRVRRLRAQLVGIEEALDRIERGAYGICASCGQRIPPARLDVLPATTFCVRCAQRRGDQRRPSEEDVLVELQRHIGEDERAEAARQLSRELESWGMSDGPQDRGRR